MSQLAHILYPSPGDEESYCLGCRIFASSKSAQEEWEKVTRHLEMSNRGREFIGEEFARLLQDWYWSIEGLAPAELQVYGGDAFLVIGKVLEEFALMQAKYKLLINPSSLLENDSSSKPVPGYNPGHIMGTGDQEPHTPCLYSSLQQKETRLSTPGTRKSHQIQTRAQHLPSKIPRCQNPIIKKYHRTCLRLSKGEHSTRMVPTIKQLQEHQAAAVKTKPPPDAPE
ncbi:hypothetical protein DSO57_1022062 [Entomophthora muscae]|uniref:Uncharacterized protein n=1 Tax=Entomophthora muscae TaxID=34485 RepID=A0ACC2RUC0_9FUNG|nr:hypothetical protein DSO57_1022062 [Entomophthora muscae]